MNITTDELKRDLLSEIEELQLSLQPLHAAIYSEDGGEAGSILLDMAGILGDLRLTACRMACLLDELTHGAA